MFPIIEMLINTIRFNHTQRKYIKIKKEQLAKLSDAELFSAILARTQDKVDLNLSVIDGMKSLNHAQRVFYAASYYEAEVNNGGLCQFFVNPSRAVAPELSDTLTEIGAEDHKQHFNTFVQENGIDITDLSSFIIDDVAQFEEQNNRYPFDAFDDRFYELRPICEYLTQYAREHVAEF